MLIEGKILFDMYILSFEPFSWYKLTNKDGKTDKERGEIDVSLQFYSKNNTTGSVLDLATKKKHLSLKDIKHSLGKNKYVCLYNKNIFIVIKKYVVE
jgi:hypothetical protein